MFGKVLRCQLALAALSLAMLTAAEASTIRLSRFHYDDVDVSRYPWSAIGKLYNEAGSACSGVVIARDKILTAAHCLFNQRTRRFIPARALHFLVGYEKGRYAAHARIAWYEIGPSFDPLRYGDTSKDDWAVLTTIAPLPPAIEPLRLSRTLPPSGTKAVIVGYPQDRAHAMAADRNCELREGIDANRLLMHTCRGISGYSGAPILVSDGADGMRIAGIQVALQRGPAGETALAVPAFSIARWEAATTVHESSPVVAEAEGGQISAASRIDGSPRASAAPAEFECDDCVGERHERSPDTSMAMVEATTGLVVAP